MRASRLRGFYYFREEVLPAGSDRSGKANLPLPTAAMQVRPLLGQLDTHPDAAMAPTA